MNIINKQNGQIEFCDKTKKVKLLPIAPQIKSYYFWIFTQYNDKEIADAPSVFDFCLMHRNTIICRVSAHQSFNDVFYLQFNFNSALFKGCLNSFSKSLPNYEFNDLENCPNGDEKRNLFLEKSLQLVQIANNELLDFFKKQKEIFESFLPYL